MTSDKPILSIITPVSRPQNIPIIKESIEKEVMPFFDVCWYCVYDVGRVKESEIICENEEWMDVTIGGIPNNIGGNSQRNIALDKARNGWIYCLDDDNILYPSFGERMINIIENNQDKKGFIFNMDGVSHGHYRNLIATPENIKVNFVNTGQAFFHKEIISDTRFKEKIYWADGVFIESIYKNNRSSIKLIDEFLCYHNALIK